MPTQENILTTGIFSENLQNHMLAAGDPRNFGIELNDSFYLEEQRLKAELEKTGIDIKRLDAETQRLKENAQHLNRELIELKTTQNKDNIESHKHRINIIEFELESIKKLQDECGAQEHVLYEQANKYKQQLDQLHMQMALENKSDLNPVLPQYSEHKAINNAEQTRINSALVDAFLVQPTTISILGQIAKHKKVVYWGIVIVSSLLFYLLGF